MVALVEVGLEPIQQRGGGPMEAVEVEPVAVAGALLLQVLPDPLGEVQLGRAGGQPGGPDPIGVLDPSRAGAPRLVVADLVQHQDEALARQRGGVQLRGPARGVGVRPSHLGHGSGGGPAGPGSGRGRVRAIWRRERSASLGRRAAGRRRGAGPGGRHRSPSAGASGRRAPPNFVMAGALLFPTIP